MNLTPRKQQCVDVLISVWQRGDLERLRWLVHPDVKRHHPRFPASSLADMLVMVNVYRTAFPDMSFEIRHAVEENDNVTLLYDVTGTHLGPFGKIPATGVRDTITCLDFFRFREDRIAEIWTMFDELGMLMKMGAIRL